VTLIRLNCPPSDFTPLRRPSSAHAARARRPISVPGRFPCSAIARLARAYAWTPTHVVGGRCRLLPGRLFACTADSGQIRGDLIDVAKEVREEVEDGPSLCLSNFPEAILIGVGTEVPPEADLVGDLLHLLRDMALLRKPVDLRYEVRVGRALLEGSSLKRPPCHSRGRSPRLDSHAAEGFGRIGDDRLGDVREIHLRQRLRVIVDRPSIGIRLAEDGAATRVARPDAPGNDAASLKGTLNAPLVREVRAGMAAGTGKHWHFGAEQHSPVQRECS